MHSNEGMPDDSLIRKANLRALGLTPSDLVKLVGSSYSYWYDLLNDPKKGFGERAARRLEERLELPRLSMDAVGSFDELQDAEKQAIKQPRVSSEHMELLRAVLTVLSDKERDDLLQRYKLLMNAARSLIAKELKQGDELVDSPARARKAGSGDTFGFKLRPDPSVTPGDSGAAFASNLRTVKPVRKKDPGK